MKTKPKIEFISGYYKDYSISEFGEVVSYKNGQTNILKPTLTNTGNWKVTLSKNGNQKNFPIQYLVASHFIPRPNDVKRMVYFIDEDKSNFCKQNLLWLTLSQWRRRLRDAGRLDSRITKTKAL